MFDGMMSLNISDNNTPQITANKSTLILINVLFLYPANNVPRETIIAFVQSLNVVITYQSTYSYPPPENSKGYSGGLRASADIYNHLHQIRPNYDSGIGVTDVIISGYYHLDIGLFLHYIRGNLVLPV